MARIVFFILLGFFCFAGSLPALAAVDIYWRPAGDNTTTYSKRPQATTNRVDIQVRVENAKTVEVNGEEAIQIGGESGLWLLRDYLLKPGDNTIKVKVEKYRFSGKSKKESTATGSLKITVIDNPVSGAHRHFESIKGSLSAFNNSVVLKLPRNTAVIDHTGRATWDQSITITTSSPNFNLYPNYIPLSPLYTIQATSPAYNLSDPGELTLKFDATAGSANNDLVTVLYALPSFKAGSLQAPMLQRVGGYNLSSGSITVPFSHTGFGHYMVVRTIKDFQDFYLKKTGGMDLEWARPYVLALWSRGIMQPLENYPDGSPVPKEYFGLTNKSGQSELPVTRHEFIGMLVKGFRLPVYSLSLQSHLFSDMQNLGITEIKHIEAAAKAGWLPNTPTTGGKLYFYPTNPLTREQACIFTANAAGLQLKSPDEATAALKAYFPGDYASTYSWYRPHILACIQSDLLTTTRQGYLEPNKPVTRAEAARIVYNVLKMKQKI